MTVEQGISSVLARKRLDASASKDQKNRHFVDVNAAYARFDGVDFSYSVMERVYFRKAHFENCNFTGCRFKDCNFRDATFLSCDLRYVDFNRCRMNVREVVSSIPSSPNWRKEVLQNLRANASSIGDVRSISFLVIQEIEASIDHHKRAFVGSEEYYRKKYNSVIDKVRSALAIVYYFVNGIVWGYGEKPLSLIVSLVSILVFLSFLNAWAVFPSVTWEESCYGLNILQYVFKTFLNINPDQRFSGFQWVDYVIGALRYVYAGLLVTTLVRSISHR